MARRSWTRAELIVAFNLYCKLPFGQYHARNARVVQLASLLGRTPNALAMKLCNFAAIDPTHQQRGIKGLAHGSRADEVIWNEFDNNWADLAAESEAAFLSLVGGSESRPTDAELDRNHSADQELLLDRAGTDVERVVKMRLGQSFFRQTVLAAYNHRVGVHGPQLRSCPEVATTAA
jgi:putative restriction endonuclease